MSDDILDKLRRYAEGQETEAVAKVEEKRRDAVQRERDRTMLARWYLTGVALDEIARRLDLTAQTVSNDLAFVRKEWRKSRVADYNTALNQQLERIDHIEERNWRAWEASQEDLVRSRGDVTNTSRGMRTSTQKTVTQRTGDSTYMATIRWCVEERSKLLGLYAAVKIAASNAERASHYDPNADQNRIVSLLETFVAHGTVDPPLQIVDGRATTLLPRPD